MNSSLAVFRFSPKASLMKKRCGELIVTLAINMEQAETETSRFYSTKLCDTTVLLQNRQQLFMILTIFWVTRKPLTASYIGCPMMCFELERSL